VGPSEAQIEVDVRPATGGVPPFTSTEPAAPLRLRYPPVTETAPRPSCVGSMRVRRRKGAQVCHSAWAPFRFFVEMEGPGLRWMRDWILGPGAWATSRTP
jgi:hypothetical protein